MSSTPAAASSSSTAGTWTARPTPVTNWFIRVPFMLEGIIQGMVGAVLALGAVFAVDRFMQSASEKEEYRAIMEGFVATSAELRTTALVVLALGIVIGAAGSGWALSRFLKV